MATTDAEMRDRIQAAASPNSLVNYGFWLYLMTDIIIFSMLFAAFMVLSQNYAGGPSGPDIFDLKEVFLETMALLLSSLTFGLAMISMAQGKKSAVQLWLLVTFLFGACFLALELNEFTELFSQGYGPQRSGFLSSFFALVGTHGTHVTFGMLWIIVMVVQIGIKGLTPPVASRLARLSLFWHFLDIVWIAVFSTVYLGAMYR